MRRRVEGDAGPQEEGRAVYGEEGFRQGKDPAEDPQGELQV